MTTTRRKYTLEFKNEAARLVTEQGYSRKQVARTLGISSKNVNRWVEELVGKKKEPAKKSFARARGN